MPTRARQALVPLVVMASVFAVSGCNVLAKLKKNKPPAPPDTTGEGTPLASSNDVPAFNKADVSRFTDETRVSNESAFIRVITFARTAPDSGGTTVGVIDADTIVIKHASRAGNTLITFDRAAFPGRRFLGWVPDAAFVVPIEAATPPPSETITTTGTTTGTRAATGTGTATPTATATATATATGTSTATPTASVAGTGTPPGTGACSMTLRTVGFTPSKPTCSFNESVRSGPATLVFPCAGGAASARFSAQTFSGTADRKRVAISNSSTSTFSGCQVRTTQTITGSPPNLSYVLSETIVGGNCKDVSTCTARATITATPTP